VNLDSPVNARLGNKYTGVIIVDNDVGFVYQYSTLSVVEGTNTPAVLRVYRIGPATQRPVSVRWTAVNGTAKAGTDYGTPNVSTPPSGTLTWAGNDLDPKTFSIPIIDDGLTEDTEYFTVVLNSPSAGNVIGSPSVATVTLYDNEPPAQSILTFSQPKFAVIENGGNAVLTVKRQPGQGTFTLGASATYTTAPGTAIPPSDFSSTTGTVYWAPADGTDKTITVPITNNAVIEPTETFKVVLSAPTPGAKIGDTGEATVVIIDDDEAFPKYGAIPDDWTVPASATKGWHVSNDPGAYEGVYSLRSDAIGDGQKAQVEVTRNFGAGNVAFRVRVSSEPVFDKLRFFVDGVEKGTWSGTATTGWTLFTTPVTAGAHTLRWSYEKDAAISVGSDAAWIDAVTLP